MHKYSCDEFSKPVNVSSAFYNSDKKINYLHHEKHMEEKSLPPFLCLCLSHTASYITFFFKQRRCIF